MTSSERIIIRSGFDTFNVVGKLRGCVLYLLYFENVCWQRPKQMYTVLRHGSQHGTTTNA